MTAILNYADLALIIFEISFLWLFFFAATRSFLISQFFVCELNGHQKDISLPSRRPWLSWHWIKASYRSRTRREAKTVKFQDQVSQRLLQRWTGEFRLCVGWPCKMNVCTEWKEELVFLRMSNYELKHTPAVHLKKLHFNGFNSYHSVIYV